MKSLEKQGISSLTEIIIKAPHFLYKHLYSAEIF